MALIPRPLYPLNFDFVDPDLARLASTIYDEVNTTFRPTLNNQNIIKTYRTFNDNFIPIIDFPVLKVYKEAESELDLNSDILVTDIVISYALAFTQPPKVGDVSTFVSKDIRRILKNLSDCGKVQINWDRGISIDYEDFIDPENVIYKYTTIRTAIYTSASSIC
jgi:hypothetical protein